MPPRSPTPRRRIGAMPLPRCPGHLNDAAAAEWRRIARALQQAGVLTPFDRAALAAYCQAWGRWVEAEERLRETPLLIKTPSGYVQQSPWLTIANKQLELMGRYMIELGLTPAARSRVTTPAAPSSQMCIERVIVDMSDRELEQILRTDVPAISTEELERIVYAPRPERPAS